MGKILGIGTLFIGGVMLADALTHPSGVQALGNATNGLVGTGSNALLGISPTTGKAA